MIQRILVITLMVAMNCFGAHSVLSVEKMDSLCKGLLSDIHRNQPTKESLLLIGKHKEVLVHSYQGKSLLGHIGKLYADATQKRERLERSLEAASNERLEGELRETRAQQESLYEVFAALVNTGKGHEPFEKTLKDLMKEFENNGENYGACITILCDAFPDIFPEPAEPENEIPEENAEEAEKAFTYVRPSNDSALAALRFKSYRYHLSRSSHLHLNTDGLTVADYCEKDPHGKTLIRYVVERWLLDCPKTEDDRKGIVRLYHRSFFGRGSLITHSDYWYVEKYNCRMLTDAFIAILNNGRNDAQFVRQLDDLMDCFLQNEEDCEPLIEIFDTTYFPGKFAAYKVQRNQQESSEEGAAGGNPAPAVQPNDQKVSAYAAADLFNSLLEYSNDDDQLSNAFEIIKERPALANAYEPSGLSVLYVVLREYCNYDFMTETRKKMLGRFFSFLLLNGADFKKRHQVRRSARVQGTFGYRTVISDVEAPSVEEVLADYTKDVSQYVSPDHPYQRLGTSEHYLSTIDSQTAAHFKKRLDEFNSGLTARFEGEEGEWLQEKMPEKPIVSGGKGAGNQEAQGQDDKELAQQKANQKGRKSFFENWKQTLKHFMTGIVLTGATYWWWNRSWGGDPLEELRQQRQRLRAESGAL